MESIDYWSTYSPMATWSMVHLAIVLALINKWHSQSINFVLAFLQVPVQTDIYMKPPWVLLNFKIPDLSYPADRYTNMYEPLHSLYGLKDAG